MRSTVVPRCTHAPRGAAGISLAAHPRWNMLAPVSTPHTLTTSSRQSTMAPHFHQGVMPNRRRACEIRQSHRDIGAQPGDPEADPKAEWHKMISDLLILHHGDRRVPAKGAGRRGRGRSAGGRAAAPTPARAPGGDAGRQGTGPAVAGIRRRPGTSARIDARTGSGRASGSARKRGSGAALLPPSAPSAPPKALTPDRYAGIFFRTK
jgi:hypothetical protein